MGGSYAEMRDAWLEADRLGFDTAWGHDHVLNQNDIARPEDEGWTVLTAGSGRDAIAAAREHHPDAVLLDMMMPEMDGLTTFEHLQSDETTRDIPVLLFTAKLQARDRQIWEGTAIRGTIAKPFDPMTLGAEVSRTLQWPSKG